jgi:GNAT superfamily N-acetyltransferase
VPGRPVPAAVVRRCGDEDWADVRRLHIRLALQFPLVVAVDLNKVFGTPDAFWQNFVRTCARAGDQAIFVAVADGSCGGMGHVALEGTLARMDMVFVDGALRRQGLGTALVEALDRWARSAGASELIGFISDASAGGDLATSLGWRRTDGVAVTVQQGPTEYKWIAAAGARRPT